MPLEIFYLFLKLGVVIEPVADVDDQIIAIVLAIEVVCDVRYAISVDFFEGRAGREGHCDNPFGYVS